MEEPENVRYRQLYFDMDGTIKQETYVFHKEMTEEKQAEYERLVADSNQMTIFDFLNNQ